MIYLYAFFVLTFLNAFKDISTKKSLESIDPGVMTGLCSIMLLCVSLPFLISEGIPSHLDSSFIWVVLGGGLFYYFGKYFNFQALSLGDISLIAPLKGLITLATVFSSIIFLDEWVNIWGGLGIILTLIGTYYLAVEKTHTSVFAPIRALGESPGSRMFLLSLFFYGFTVTFDRMGIQASSIWMWAVLMNVIVLILSSRDLYKHRKNLKSDIMKRIRPLMLLLVLHAWIYLSQMYIVSQVISPYTSSFKSASALFAVAIGGWYFQEKHLLQRFMGACIIVLGIVLISFFG